VQLGVEAEGIPGEETLPAPGRSGRCRWTAKDIGWIAKSIAVCSEWDLEARPVEIDLAASWSPLRPMERKALRDVISSSRVAQGSSPSWSMSQFRRTGVSASGRRWDAGGA